MAAWLLTWNPDRWEWDNYDEDCEEASKAHPLDFGWSCVSKKAQSGDEFYLLKLGKLPRGIIAHGIITEGIVDDEHWDNNRAGKRINYIAGECDTLLNYKTQDILEVSVLDEKCPKQFWHPQSSGIRIRDEVLPMLQELWVEVTKDYPDNPEESVHEEEDDGAGGIVEGTKKSVYTTTYERDPNVRRTFLKGKQLKCEVCGFDFEKAYGKLGAGYIEVHHKKPVSEGVRMTDLNNDLAMLCSNCHRMIHRGRDHMITVEELKGIVDANA
ncbi:MAG: HNH endonuclease [Synergistaceae bacterium]|nr:HNH endonuclease [Synergistaceae bacterium]MBQ3398727.1 HNH endonuclease [Synergistaceae bacterium]MBQ3758341.1 HNH endonuclease [Synergistaceae bacterium]MBQ6002386.1 HNH endonuclease [Synergistaceae bacterium]MBQ6418537.1 HNH endonuclease [Synergistaceae bacterium]